MEIKTIFQKQHNYLFIYLGETWHICSIVPSFLFSFFRSGFYSCFLGKHRVALLMVASLFVTTLLRFPSSILVTTFVGIALAFACFSAATMLARCREYVGGVLSSGLTILLWLHFASAIFGGSAAVFNFEVRRLIIYKSFFFWLIMFYFCAYWNRWWQTIL